MSQVRFNELVDQFIKVEAAKKVRDSFSQKGNLIWDHFYNVRDMIKNCEAELKQKKQQGENIDQQINSLSAKFEKSNEIRDEATSEQIEVLAIKKACLECEILYLENELTVKRHGMFNILKDPDVVFYNTACLKFRDERNIFIEKMERSIAITNADMKPNDISYIVKEIIKMEEIVRLKTICEKINHFCKSHYEYNVSYNEIIKKISAIVNSSYWENLANVDLMIHITAMRKIISNRSYASPETLYKELKNTVKEVMNPGFFDKKCENINLLNLCVAIENIDLISFEVLVIKLDIVNSKNNVREKNELADPIKPKLIDKKFEDNSENQNYSAIINLYLLFKAAAIAAQESIVLIQHAIDKFKLLELEIERLKNLLAGIPIKLKSLKEEENKIDSEYISNIHLYPSLEADLQKNYISDKTDIEVNIVHGECRAEKIEKTLHQKQIQYNNMIAKYKSNLRQCLTLSQYAAHLQKNYITHASLQIEKNHPDYTKSTINFLIEEYHSNDKFDKSATIPMILNDVLKKTEQYTVSYQDLNLKIINLINHPHWKCAKQDDGDMRGVLEIAQVFIDPLLTAKEHFESAQEIAKNCISSPFPFWSTKLNTDAKLLYQAILNMDILQLEKLTIRFNFQIEDDNLLTFHI